MNEKRGKRGEEEREEKRKERREGKRKRERESESITSLSLPLCLCLSFTRREEDGNGLKGRRSKGATVQRRVRKKRKRVGVLCRCLSACLARHLLSSVSMSIALLVDDVIAA